MTDMPHPEKPAVDAAATGFLEIVCDMRQVPAAERPKFGDFDAVQKLTLRNHALRVLNPATPHLAAQVARALAADLDARGEFRAATRLHEIAGTWVSATIPDDLSGLF